MSWSESIPFSKLKQYLKKSFKNVRLVFLDKILRIICSEKVFSQRLKLLLELEEQGHFMSITLPSVIFEER